MLRFIMSIFMIQMIFIHNTYAFDDKITHLALTDEAIRHRKDILNSYFKNNLFLGEGIETYIGSKKIADLLQAGSVEEDKPNCRASNHFHNPGNELSWDTSGMSDEPWFVDRACRGTDYPPEIITSSAHWATGYTGPASASAKKATGNFYDWDHAREEFHSYLTGRDYLGRVVAAKELTRNIQFRRSLGHLGQVLHLLQDMAVPSHVRNDFLAHLEWKGITGSSLRDPTAWVHERFEDFVKTNGALISGASGGDLEEKSLTNCHRQFETVVGVAV
jgi:hypothetical protein